MNDYIYTPKVGDHIQHIKHGNGIIKQIDEKSRDFRYYAEFQRKDGDGTKMWMSVNDEFGKFSVV